MRIAPYIFKSKAIRALKGNWQTALLVSFFSSLPLTLLQVVQTKVLPDISQLTSQEAMRAAVLAIPQQTWLLLGILGGLSMVITPVLFVGCNQYFIKRIQGNELGFRGLFSRLNITGKSLALYLLMYVKAILWSLLLVVPGIIAFLRYSMAPYYLAQDPQLSPLEALNKSKETMKDKKLTFWVLQISFMGWLLAALFAEMALGGVSPILALVASQFIQLFLATYLNAASACFYLAVAAPGGVEKALRDAALWMRSVGARMPFGNDDNTDNSTDDPSGEGDADEPDDGTQKSTSGEDDTSDTEEGKQP